MCAPSIGSCTGIVVIVGTFPPTSNGSRSDRRERDRLWTSSRGMGLVVAGRRSPALHRWIKQDAQSCFRRWSEAKFFLECVDLVPFIAS